MNEHPFVPLALSSFLGTVFGGLMPPARRVWPGDDRMIRNVRTAARRSGRPRRIARVHHRIFVIAAGVALLVMLALVLTGLLAIVADFTRLYVVHLIVAAVLGTAAIALWDRRKEAP